MVFMSSTPCLKSVMRGILWVCCGGREGQEVWEGRVLYGEGLIRGIGFKGGGVLGKERRKKRGDVGMQMKKP